MHKIKKTNCIFATSLAVIFFALACKSSSQIQTTNQSETPQSLISVEATLAGHTLNLMLARTLEEKRKGLMYFDSLPETSGMLFVYDEPQQMSFWMLNTKIELDLIFLSENLEVIEWIEGMKPGYGQSATLLPNYTSSQKAQYALEVNAGLVKKINLQVGDLLNLPLTFLYSE